MQATVKAGQTGSSRAHVFRRWRSSSPCCSAETGGSVGVGARIAAPTAKRFPAANQTGSERRSRKNIQLNLTDH